MQGRQCPLGSSVSTLHKLCDPGQQAGRVGRSPLGEASEPRRSGTGVPPAQGLLSAPSNTLHMELLSQCRPSIPVTALFCRTGLSCLQEASCVSHILQELFSALGQLSLGGLLLGGVLFSGLVTVQADTFSRRAQTYL